MLLLDATITGALSLVRPGQAQWAHSQAEPRFYGRLSLEEALLVQVLSDDLDGTLDVDFVCPDVDLGLGRGFVRGGNTGELCL